jgi:hypothetical protein
MSRNPFVGIKLVSSCGYSIFDVHLLFCFVIVAQRRKCQCGAQLPKFIPKLAVIVVVEPAQQRRAKFADQLTERRCVVKSLTPKVLRPSGNILENLAALCVHLV